MRKSRVKAIIAVCLILFTAPAFAMDVMVGAKAGYYVWKPFYKDLGASGMNEIDNGTGMLAGPILSLLFTPDLTFSLAGLAGRQSTHWQAVFGDYSDPAVKITGGYYCDTLRVDIDSALSYRLSDNLKLFAGYKLLYLRTDYKYTELRTDAAGNLNDIDIQDMQFVTPFHGPALGFGASFPLSDRVFTSANISILYQLGYFKLEDGARYTGNPTPITSIPASMKSAKMEQYGLNVEPSIGFNPGGGLPVISLGVRFQWLRVRFTEERDYLPDTDHWMNDYLYGVFVSAVYVF